MFLIDVHVGKMWNEIIPYKEPHQHPVINDVLNVVEGERLQLLELKVKILSASNISLYLFHKNLCLKELSMKSRQAFNSWSGMYGSQQHPIKL